MRRINIAAITGLVMMLAFNVQAYEVSVEFSADAIQVAPGNPTIFSKMYVSKSAIRTEMSQQGQYIADIKYPKEGRRVLLFTNQKNYMEQTDLPVAPSLPDKKTASPCVGMENTSCHKLGEESLQEIMVEKWQVERVINNKTHKSLHWIDKKRGIAMKELLSDGSVTELIMLGKGDLNGRSIERWETRSTHPSGQSRISKQWYDTELKMVIREELQGGFLRELSNIKVGKQDKDLFTIPKDFKKISQDENSTKNSDKQ